jgi:hypothetical protein
VVSNPPNRHLLWTLPASAKADGIRGDGLLRHPHPVLDLGECLFDPGCTSATYDFCLQLGGLYL